MQPQVADLSGEISEEGHNATEKVGVSPLLRRKPQPLQGAHAITTECLKAGMYQTNLIPKVRNRYLQG